MATPITEKAHIDFGNWKMVGVFMMAGSVAIMMGLSSGTGRPHGGRMYKGGPSF